MPAIPSGADELANDLLDNLTVGVAFSVPVVDPEATTFDQPLASGPLYATIDTIDVDDLTTGAVNGTGVFDKLMTSLVAHLKVEYTANRISGAEYTKAYIGIVGAALQTAQQFLLTREQAYWGALLVQAQAKTADVQTITARLELERARVALAQGQFEAATAEVNYGLGKMKIATEDVTYGNLALQGTGIGLTNTTILPKQANLLLEQIEVQRAQTMDTRVDGVTTITGAVGKQKALYTQQIASYQRDSEMKVAKLFSDAWITQKTIDEGLLAPTQYTNTEINEVLAAVRLAAGLGS